MVFKYHTSLPKAGYLIGPSMAAPSMINRGIVSTILGTSKFRKGEYPVLNAASLKMNIHEDIYIME
jgi:hypothetical protein